MKRSWVTAYVVAVLAIVSAPPAQAVESFDTVLPEGTVVHVSVRDVPEFLSKVGELPAYKVIEQGKLLEKFMPTDALTEVRGFWGKFIQPLGEILQGEMAFAITSIEEIDDNPSLVLLAEVGEAALADYLEKAIYPLLEAKGVEPEELTLSGLSITRIANPDYPSQQVLFGTKNGVLVIARRQDTIEALVKSLGGAGEETLAVNKGFADVRQALGKADLLAYVNVGAFVRRDEEAMAEYEYDAAFDTWGRLRATTGFTRLSAIGFGVALRPEGGTTTIRVSGDGPRGGMFAGLARKAPPLKSTEYVAEDAAFFAAVSLGSLSQAYADFTTALKRFYEASPQRYRERPKEAIAAIEGALEMKLAEELLPAFGGEVTVAAWIPGGLDVPPAAMMVEVKDEATVEKFVGRVLELIGEATEGEVTMTAHRYEGVQITSLDGVPMVIPAVAIVGDFLVVATNPSVIEDMVDTLAEGKHLGQSDGYKRYVSSLPGDAAITMYVDARRIFEYGFPLLTARVGGDEEEQASLKALEALGQCLSGFGMKVVGDENGITVTSRSANGGLEPMSLLGGIVAMSSLTVVERTRTPGTSSVEFGEPGGFVPEVGGDEDRKDRDESAENQSE